jgi:hypothetical protein
LLIITLTSASALRINELEANPPGEDSGNEWVELYSDTEVSLDGYVLDHVSSGAPINLSGTFTGYFVISLQTRWLRNTNETVYLKINGNVVDSVGPFNDNKNNDLTYGLCDEWKLSPSSRNTENLCSSPQTQTTSNTNNQNNNQASEEEQNIKEIYKNSNKTSVAKEVTSEAVENTPVKLTKISLVKKKSQESEITKTYKTRIGVIYFFIGFCVLLVILIAFRRI